MVTATAILHKDVYGKEMYYIALTGVTGERYMINVGKKTYEECKRLSEKEPPKGK